LLRLLNGLVPLSEGHVRTDELGLLTGKRSWRAHQRRTAMIFQQHQLIERHSSLENVLMGRLPFRSEWKCFLPWDESEKRISLECLERVGLLDKARERVSNLSGGQMQRVGIAKALAQEPKLMLADEPVASLDPVTAEQVISFLKEICMTTGITTIISLHQVELARKFADRIIGVSAGRISFDGKPQDLNMEKTRILYGTGVANM
jgi:phosphonate transport system ATP-binding protein